MSNPGSTAPSPGSPPTTAPPLALRYLSRRHIESLGLSAADLVEPVRAALTGKASGSEAPAKMGVHPRPSAALHAAAGFLASEDIAGIKWISRYPDNPAAGLDVCAGLCVLNDAGSGIPGVVMDASWITEARTAAATAVALLATRPDGVPEVTLLGLGVQGVAHLRALPLTVPGLQRIRVLTRHPDRARERLAGEHSGVEVLVADTAEQALRGAPAVVSALPMRQPAEPCYDATLLAHGAVVVAVDFDAAWHPDVARSATAFLVDDGAQYRHFRDEGWFSGYPSNPTDITDVLIGRTPVPTGPTFIAMMGIGLEDVAAADLVRRRAEAAGVGQILER